MNTYVTGAIIKRLREEKKMTQAELAGRICVSDKAVSRWETGKGYPDITLIEPLGAALGVSVAELLSGTDVVNRNRSFDMTRCGFHVCPVCGNIIFSTGEAMISCCGITLPPLEAEEASGEHLPRVEAVEDEYYVSLCHPMSREHSVSFIAALRYSGAEIVKLYPEGAAEARFKISGTDSLYIFCNRHGLFRLARPLAVNALRSAPAQKNI